MCSACGRLQEGVQSNVCGAQSVSSEGNLQAGAGSRAWLVPSCFHVFAVSGRSAGRWHCSMDALSQRRCGCLHTAREAVPGQQLAALSGGGKAQCDKSLIAIRKRRRHGGYVEIRHCKNADPVGNVGLLREHCQGWHNGKLPVTSC